MPVDFVDIDPHTRNMSVAALADKLERAAAHLDSGAFEAELAAGQGCLRSNQFNCALEKAESALRIESKDPRAIIDPLGDRVRTLTVVPVPGHDHHAVDAFGPQAKASANVEDALLGIPPDDYPILIAGSLYLAGEVLRLNHELPD